MGEFFNTNFVSAKFDMEKGEGIELAKKYNVRAFPTLLFLNGDGEIVHRFCGSSPKEQFLKSAAVALNKEERLGTYISRYEGGDRDLDFMKELLLKASAACMDMKETAADYWNLQPKENWLSEENWKLFKIYVRDINSAEFQYFLSHLNKVKSNKEEEKDVDEYAGRVIYSALAGSIYRADKEQLEKDRKSIGGINTDFARIALAKSYIFEHQKAKDWTKFAEHVSDYIKGFGTDEASYINSLAWFTYKNAEDREVLLNAAGWMELVLDKEENQNYAFTDTYAALLLKSGNIEEGTKAANKAIEIAKAAGTDYKGTEELLATYK